MDIKPQNQHKKQIYICPTCGEKMERDLLLFIRHTDAHVVDELKKKHPEWVTNDGFCPKCLDHYKAAMKGEVTVANIAGREVNKRQLAGILAMTAFIALLLGLLRFDYSRNYRLILWFPLFSAIVCFFQVKRNHCVVLGLKGAKNMDHGEEAVVDSGQKKLLKKESEKILIWSILLAAALTVVCYFI